MRISLFIALTIILAGIVLYFYTTPFKEQEHLENEAHTVLDCSSNTEACAYHTLTETIEHCEKPFINDSITSSEELGCTFTKEGVAKIHYISDYGNHIPTPFTRDEFSVEVITDSLDEPWDFAILPDGSFLVTEKKGNIVYLKDGDVQVIKHIDVVSIVEAGLMGISTDPQFSSNGYVYLYYTYAFDPEGEATPHFEGQRKLLNRVSRFTLKGDTLTDETILLNAIPASGWHAGGRIVLGPDGKLYVTTGDAQELKGAQSSDFLGGKILRMNLDGSVPEDNPTLGSYVYSRGHRNPQGLAFDIQNSTLYESEHGEARYDEINAITPNQNYGWGGHKCDDTSSTTAILAEAITNPIVCSKTWTMSPSGMVFVNDPESEWYGSLFVAMLRGKHIHRYVFNDDATVRTDEIFFVSDGKEYSGDDLKGALSERLRTVQYHNGALYILGDSHGLVAIRPN